MKKTAALLLCLCLVLGLAACGGSEPASDVDLDLTGSGGTVLYAQLCRMTDETAEYEGKSVRLTGEFSPYPVHFKDGTTQMRFSCVVWDSTKCCTAGLDFVVEGAVYPDDYPDAGKTITVEGVFRSDVLFGITRGVLTDAKITKGK